MKKLKFVFMIAALIATGSCASAVGAQTPRWPEQKANTWYAQQPWLVGSNYVPKSAINQLEMWQEATFNPDKIEREFAWAEAMGMNTMRVFLHDLLWQQDAAGFPKRIDRFLTIASRHHIRPMFVLFDSCWDPLPHLGPQHPPIPGVHNSGWVQGPGAAALADSSQQTRLKAYVQGVVGSHLADPSGSDVLFGSVTAADIASALDAKGFEVDRRKLQLADPIKKLGDYDVPLKLYRDVVATVKVKVVAEGAQK